MASPTDFKRYYQFTESSGPLAEDSAGNAAGLIAGRIAQNSESPVLSGFQGYSTDGTSHFITATDAIYKYSADYSTVEASNTSPFASLPGAPSHLGDCKYHNGKLYVTASGYAGCGNVPDIAIAIYDATTLAYETHIVLPDNTAESGVTIDPVGGYFYLSNYCSSEIIKRSFPDGGFIESISPSFDLIESNGIDFLDGNLWVSVALGKIVVVDATTGDAIAGYTLSTSVECEGIDVSHGVLRHLSFDARVREYSLPSTASPPRTAGQFDAAQAYSVFVPFTMPDDYTFIFNATPNSFFNYNSLIDSDLDPNIYESWIYSDGRWAWREYNSVIYSALSDPTVEREFAIRCDVSGNVSLWIDKAEVATGTTDKAGANRYIHIGGGHIGNTASDATYTRFAVFDRALTDQEIVDWDGSLRSPVDASLSLVRSLAAVNSPQGVFGAGVAMTRSLSTSDGGQGNYAASMDLLRSLASVFSTAGGVSASVALSVVLSAEPGAVSSVSALLDLAKRLASASSSASTLAADVGFDSVRDALADSSALVNAAINYGALIDSVYSTTGGVSFANASMGITLDILSGGAASALADLGLSRSASISITQGLAVYDAVSLAIQRGEAVAIEIGVGADIDLSSILGSGADSAATAAAGISFAVNSAIAVISAAAANAGVDLATGFTLSASGGTISAGLVTPEGRRIKVAIGIRTSGPVTPDRIIKPH